MAFVLARVHLSMCVSVQCILGHMQKKRGYFFDFETSLVISLLKASLRSWFLML